VTGRVAAVRRRSRQAVPRLRLVKFFLTDEELAELDEAAGQAGRPAQAGVTCPRDWRAAAGWETATGPAPGHAQPGRSDRRLTPASHKGPGSA
jgi:hypothetical protein